MKKSLLLILLSLVLLLSSCQSSDNEPFCSEQDLLIAGICHDKTPPEIFGMEDTNVAFGVTFDPMLGVSSYDDFDGDLTDTVFIHGEVNINEFGTYFLKYTVVDDSGNEKEAVRYITVVFDASTDVDMVINGDFSYNLFAWHTYTISSGGNANFSVVDGVLKVEIISINEGIAWEPRIHNEGFYLEIGVTYRVTFDARSDAPRTIKMHIGELFNVAPYFTYLMADGEKHYDLTTSFQTFTTTFTMIEDSNLNVSILFEFGDIDGPFGTENLITNIYIDNVVIEVLEE